MTRFFHTLRNTELKKRFDDWSLYIDFGILGAFSNWKTALILRTDLEDCWSFYLIVFQGRDGSIQPTAWAAVKAKRTLRVSAEVVPTLQTIIIQAAKCSIIITTRANINSEPTSILSFTSPEAGQVSATPRPRVTLLTRLWLTANSRT